MTTTTRTAHRRRSRVLIAACVGTLLIAAAGVLWQYAAAPQDFPTVPPGPLVLTVAAVFVASASRWWWSPLVAVGTAMLIGVGGLLSGGLRDNLTGSPVLAVGASLMLIGLAGSVFTGLATSFWLHQART